MRRSGAEPLHSFIAMQLAGACDWPDAQRDCLVQAIRERYGDGIVAILVYGSYLRGKRDTLLDFYVLVESYAAMRPGWHSALAWMLSPNVYQVCQGEPPGEARAKYAVMTLDRFERAMQGDFHSYFWARFFQPSGLLFCRDESSRNRVMWALTQAAETFIRRVVPLLPPVFSTADLVRIGLSNTYRCELRSEPAGHAEALYGHNAGYYQSVVGTLAAAGLGYHPDGDADSFRNEAIGSKRRRAELAWGWRRVQGKLLSVARLLKATLTFAGGFDYLLWKIRRHSGIYLEPTQRQRRHPLLFGWPLLWRLYRRGAFR